LQDRFTQFLTQLSTGSYLNLLVEHLYKIIKVNSHRLKVLYLTHPLPNRYPYSCIFPMIKQPWSTNQ